MLRPVSVRLLVAHRQRLTEQNRKTKFRSSQINLLSILLLTWAIINTGTCDEDLSLARRSPVEKWTVSIRGGMAEADKLAAQHNCKNLGLVKNFRDVYLFEKEIHNDTSRQSYGNLNRVHRIKRRLESNPNVLWVDPQFPQSRVKRDMMDKKQLILAAQQHQQLYGSAILSDGRALFVAPSAVNLQAPAKPLGQAPQQLAQPNQKQVIQSQPNKYSKATQQPLANGSLLVENLTFDDELWTYQWYLHDNTNVAQIQSGVELNVEEVWKMGYTGKGIVVTILDDGLEWNHTDIYPNYDARASWDMNNNRPDPFPQYDSRDSNSHGTRCAGEVAMVANNRKCGVGVAPRAKIGGIKCLDGEVADHVEASSISHNIDHIDIYSASWGPPDDGKAVDGPKRMASQALEQGIKYGRKGKGVLYVWANGNGGGSGDNCNCDGYVNSIFTISVGAVTQQGQIPFYGERCASTLAVACSSGVFTERKIVTTDLHNKCTIDYTGTSAAAPLAAGVFALVLEANNNLTWRDAQHLTAWTSNPIPIRDNRGWKQNGAGLVFNSRFGFGLLNAKAMVDAALKWQQVPKKSICLVAPSTRVPVFLQSRQMAQVVFVSDGCQHEFDQQQQHQMKQQAANGGRLGVQSAAKQGPSPVIYLEHVQLIVDIEYTSRGSLDIFLISPAGTISTMLSRRPLDKARTGFDKWPLTSVHFWGETSIGKWTVIVRDKDSQNSRGLLRNAELKLHGTTLKPAHMMQRRVYSEDIGPPTSNFNEPNANSTTNTQQQPLSFIDPTIELEEEDIYDLNTFPNEMALVRDDSYQPTFIKSIIAQEQQKQLRNKIST